MTSPCPTPDRKPAVGRRAPGSSGSASPSEETCPSESEEETTLVKFQGEKNEQSGRVMLSDTLRPSGSWSSWRTGWSWEGQTGTWGQRCWDTEPEISPPSEPDGCQNVLTPRSCSSPHPSASHDTCVGDVTSWLSRHTRRGLTSTLTFLICRLTRENSCCSV